MNETRPELPPIPGRMRSLPVRRGYPVPFFVQWMKDDEPVSAGEGEPDFRIMSTLAAATAIDRRLCWVCGGRLGAHVAFTLGPMCAVNRTSAEPPSHLECAEFSAKACPFLSRPHARRRDAGKPADATSPAGIMLERNPGVALVWVTRKWRAFADPDGGILFRMGDPDRILWLCEGRDATRAEVMDSIESGLPALRELAEQDGRGAVRELERLTARALKLVPA